MIFSVLFALIVNLFRILAAPLVLLRRARAAPSGAWVRLVIDGGLVVMAPPRSRLPWAPRPTGLALDRVRELVTALLADPRPRGLLVTLSSLSAAPALRTALRDELARVRAAGRPLVVHLPLGGSTAELFVASVADRVLVGVETSLGPLGFSRGSLYFRRALDRVGLVPEVHAAGEYKSAGEPLLRDGMSDEQREQSGRLLDGLHEELVTALETGRGLTRESAARAIDRGLVSAAAALELGLADAIVHDDEVAHALERERSEKKAVLVPAAFYLRRRAATVFRRVLPRRKIAVVALHGAILERAPMPLSNVCEAEKIAPVLLALEDDPSVVAVVLHVDSPGGGVLASEKIHRAVARLAKKKPVVACMGGVAASGGYYVSAPTACIVAAPTTITGSIGVVAARVVAGPFLARFGVSYDSVRRGARAEMLSPLHDLDEGERVAFDAEIERAYRRFVAIVAEGRRRTVEEIDLLARGRVWSGVDAHARGLVDRLGGLEVALEEARSRANAPEADAILLAPRAPIRPLSLARLLPIGALEALGFAPWVDVASLTLGARDRVWAVALIDRQLS